MPYYYITTVYNLQVVGSQSLANMTQYIGERTSSEAAYVYALVLWR